MPHKENLLVCSCGRRYKLDFRFPLRCLCGITHTEDGRAIERVATDETRLRQEITYDEPLTLLAPLAPLAPRLGGPGTELTKRLYWLAWLTGKTKCCRCKRLARIMDRMGCDWCEENINTLVQWLRKSHSKLPRIIRAFISFNEARVRQLVLDAITSAREKLKKQELSREPFQLY